MDDRFHITLCDNITLEVRPVIERHNIAAFQLFIDDTYYGEVYPDIENAFVEWKTFDRIDPTLVQSIGNAIDDHYS